jgi:tetratricopeptide (TPR) repeat protein
MADVDAAYCKLARLFHPDAHHEAPLLDLQSQIEAVFVRLAEARRVLGDPALRARYEQGLAAAEVRRDTPPAMPALAAAGVETHPATEALEAAEERFAKGKYWDAITLLEACVEHAEGRERQKARVLLAQCYLKNPRWRRNAEEELIAAVRENAGDVEAYYHLGVLYRDGNLPSRAAAMFRRCLELKPRHAAAQAALAALPPGEHAAATVDSGFFKKLLG